MTSFWKSTKALARLAATWLGTAQVGSSGACAGSRTAGTSGADAAKPASRAASAPARAPSAKHAASVKLPLAAPAERSGWTDWPGTKAAASSSKRSLPRDCENRWTVGFQPPETSRQSQRRARGSPGTRLPSACIGETQARLTRRRPSVPTTAAAAPDRQAGGGSSGAAGLRRVRARRSTIASIATPARARSRAAA